MTNSHSLFYIGPFIVLCKLFESIITKSNSQDNTTKFYFLILILCILACFVNPYGIKGILFPLKLIPKVLFSKNVYKNTIYEYSKPDFFNEDLYYGIYFFITLIFIISFINEKKYFPAFVMISTGFLCLKATRNFNLLLFSSLH